MIIWHVGLANLSLWPWTGSDRKMLNMGAKFKPKAESYQPKAPAKSFPT
jgi:hypothetical protein